MKLLSTIWAALSATALAATAPAGKDKMIDEHLMARGVKDEHVLQAMRAVPREDFVPDEMKPMAYADRPLPIGDDQTISQPYIVAFMTELLQLKHGEKVLEIGTGSGYQAAVLKEITPHVFTIEIVENLYRRTKPLLLARGFKEEQVILGDGYKGLPAEAPFDGIIVTAAPDHIPQPLIDQLAPGGRMVIPVGPTGRGQSLMVVTKDAAGNIEKKDVLPVSFVPFTGEAEQPR